MSRLTNTVFPDLTSTSVAYDANGRRTNSVDQLGRVTQYFYDAVGQLTNTVCPDSTSSSTVYDLDGQVQYSIDARGFTNAFGYDVIGEQIAVTNGFSTPSPMVMTYAYDASGNRTNMVDALTHTTSYSYDALNRLTTATFQDGTTQITSFDADGRKISQTDQATNTTQFAYDVLGRLIYVTNALNKVTAYAYDEVGNQTNQVDALSHKTTFEFDALGRRIRRTLPGGQSETNGYDAVGNLIYYTNFNGLVITNQYDSMNRLLGRWHGATQLEGYTYDPAGQLTNRTDTSGNYTWVFDNRGRVTTNITPVGTLHYGYDNNGNQTSLASATSGGVNLAYQYDALNRLTNVLDVNLGMSVTNTAYTYDLVGNLQTLKYPNGVTNLWQYDSLNRLTNLVSKLTTNNLASFYYQLGPSGNRTNLSETLGSAGRSFAWGYDKVYRLTNETASGSSPTGTLNYTYDDVGNRLVRTNGGFSLTNQLFTFNSNDWLNTDGYDSNGNTTTNTSSQIYQYDYANRLTNFNSGAVVIVYASDGNRLQKVTSTATNLYLVSAANPTGYPQVVEEFTVAGSSTNLSKVYTYGLSLISQRVPGASTNFFGMDGHGSTRFLTDIGGNVANVFAYDAYGTLISSNTTAQTAYLYSGEQLDTDLGFYYLRARYMNPNTGRFSTMDTDEGGRADPVSLHKYLYGGANPVNRIDPSGHDLVDLLVTTAISSTLDSLILPVISYASSHAIAGIIPNFISDGLASAINPNAFIVGTSLSLNIQNKGFGFSGGGGIEGLWSPRTENSAIYAFAGGGVSFGTTRGVGSLQFYAGDLFHCKDAEGYRGPFWVVSLPYGKLPTKLKNGVNRMADGLMAGLIDWVRSAKDDPASEILHKTFAPSAVLNNSSISFFWSPDNNAWGFLIGYGIAESDSSSNVTLGCYGYEQLYPENNENVPFQ